MARSFVGCSGSSRASLGEFAGLVNQATVLAAVKLR
jgi:hypothetical protein